MQQRGLLSVADLKKALENYLTENNQDSYYIDLIEIGYCDSSNILALLISWQLEEYPKLFPNCDQAALEWLTKFFDQLKALNYYNISQNSINDRFKAFFRSDFPEVKDSMLSSEYASRDKWIKSLEHGQCSGYAFLVGILLMVHYQIEPNHPEKNPWNKLDSFFLRFSFWNKTDNLSREMIAELINIWQIFYFAQHANSLLGIAQSDWHRIFERLYQEIIRFFDIPKLTLVPQLHKIDSVVLPFNKMNIQRAIIELFDLEEKSTEPRLLLFNGDKHATTMVKKDNITFYNSNNKKGVCSESQNNLNVLSSFIHSAHHKKRACFSAGLFGFTQQHQRRGQKLLDSVDKTQLTHEEKIDALCLSILNDDDISFKFWLENKVDVNAKCQHGYAPVHHAARARRPQMLRRLLEEKADLSIKTEKKQRTPLHLAARFNCVVILNVLITAAEATLYATDRNGKFPIELACSDEVRETLSRCMLIYSIAKANFVSVITLIDQYHVTLIKNESRNTSIVLHAAHVGDLPIFMELHKAGANIYAEDQLGNTALKIAVKTGNAALVDYLVKNNTDRAISRTKCQEALELATHKDIKIMLNALSADIARQEQRSKLAEKRNDEAIQEFEYRHKTPYKAAT